MTKTNEYKSIGINEKLIDAINLKDLDFIKENIDKINFSANIEQSTLGNWDEISIFQNLISMNFIEGFKIIFDKYCAQKKFLPYTDKFHYIIINCCHYAKADFLDYVHKTTHFDLDYHDSDHLGLIHHVFESFNNSTNFGNSISDDDIYSTIKWLEKKKCKIYEVYPPSSEGLNNSIYRRYYHNIFTFLIVKEKFDIALKLFPKPKDFSIIQQNVKSEDTVRFLYRFLKFHFRQNEHNFVYDVFDQNAILSRSSAFDFEKGQALLLEFINKLPTFTEKCLYDEDFLFNIYSLSLLLKIKKDVIPQIVDFMFDDTRINDEIFDAPTYLIRKHFNSIYFFDLLSKLKKKKINIYEKLTNNEKCIDESVSFFQIQQMPPSKAVLKKQIEFFKSIDPSILNKKNEDKNNFSYVNFINDTISGWKSLGYNVSAKF